MKRLLSILLALSALLAAPAPRARAASDPRAVQVAEGVLRALGGRAKWDALTGLSWSFGSSVNDTARASRRHDWNKHTGAHRVSGTMRDGAPFVIVHTLGDSTGGSAWVNGTPIEGDSLHKLVKRAEAMWVNDSYWFLMPYKMLDPGVNLKYDGEVRDSAGTFDRIAMSFDHVGLTPGDRYWVDVERSSHRVRRWQYVLEGQQPPPQRWTWEGWEPHDGLWFPTAHRRDNLNVFTRDVVTSNGFSRATFRSP